MSRFIPAWGEVPGTEIKDKQRAEGPFHILTAFETDLQPFILTSGFLGLRPRLVSFGPLALRRVD